VQSVDRRPLAAAADILDRAFYNAWNKQPRQVSKGGPNEQKYIHSTLFPFKHMLRKSASKYQYSSN
jgi:hypothetical protein